MLLLAAALIASCLPSLSAEPPFQLIPTLGFRGGADLDGEQTAQGSASADPSVAYGLTLDYDLRPDAWFEGFYERQKLEFTGRSGTLSGSTFDVAVDYLQAGASYAPPSNGLRWYVTAALGLSYFSADGASVSDAFGLSGSIGGGFQIPLGKRVGFRLEARGYGTLTDATFAATCGPGCSIRLSGSGWFQLGARAGLAFRL